MPKDRLAALKAKWSYWSDESYESDESLCDKTHDVVFTVGNETIDIVRSEVEEIREMIDEVEEQVTRVRKKCDEVLLSLWTEQMLRQELEELIDDIHGYTREIKTKLSELEDMKQIKKNTYFWWWREKKNAGSRVRELQHLILTRKFFEVIRNYNKVQIDFIDKSKKIIQTQLATAGRTVSEERLDVMLIHENPEILTGGLIAETQQMKQILADITARHSDIKRLKMLEILKMSLEMLLVADQSEIIDCVEYHVDSAKEYVKPDGFEAPKAQQYALKARRKKIMLTICLVVTLSVLIIIFIFI